MPITCPAVRAALTVPASAGAVSSVLVPLAIGPTAEPWLALASTTAPIVTVCVGASALVSTPSESGAVTRRPVAGSLLAASWIIACNWWAPLPRSVAGVKLQVAPTTVATPILVVPS